MNYKTATAFRQALESRLNSQQLTLPGGVQRLRKAVAFERFMARLQAGADERLLLKGGFALQLRASTHARFTRDLDVSVNLKFFSAAGVTPATILTCLREGARQNLSDFFAFEVGTSTNIPIPDSPNRAFRFPIRALLDGRSFESFHADTGVGDPLVEKPISLPPLDLLSFSGLPPVGLKSIAPEQHFAEKLHALTLRRDGIENTRSHDLIDLMILLDLNLGPAPSVLNAVNSIFRSRGTHAVPHDLDDPPASWDARYSALVGDVRVVQTTVRAAMERLREYWAGVLRH